MGNVEVAHTCSHCTSVWHTFEIRVAQRSLRYRTELRQITALMYEQKPCPVWLTVRYSVNKG